MIIGNKIAAGIITYPDDEIYIVEMKFFDIDSFFHTE